MAAIGSKNVHMPKCFKLCIPGPQKLFKKENPLTHLCSMGNYTFKMCKSNGVYFEYLCKKLFFKKKKKSYNTVFW